MNKVSIQYHHERYTPEQNAEIERALDFAAEAHSTQRRKSGEPYIIHPLSVAEIVAEWGLDHEAIMAALLHDVVEDTDITVEQIERAFGPRVALLVDGVTKLAEIEAMPGPEADSARLEVSNENLRKLLLATTQDFRVLIIKLADRLHNLRTLGYLKPEKRQRIARESLDVFAPLADRLGMGQLKGEIEDLSFRYWKPEEFAGLSTLVATTARKSKRYLVLLKHDINDFLEAGGAKPISIEGRQKHLYSIYKKLAKTDGDIEKIYDLIAIRILVPDVAACYQALGLIHQHYKPLIYRIKDYIAVPKPNGYQSLHTTVFALDGRITEIQIRTPHMHDEAERGLAAHFYYDAQKTTAAYTKGAGAGALPDKLKWVNEISSLQQTSATRGEFVEGVKLELFSDRIFVFSPLGDLYDLPEGSTPVDFAFAIHSGIGLRAMGARVNGKMVTLDTRLENRDVVEIITRREQMPNRDWLGFVKTSQAKNRIRSWFRAASRDANIASGRLALETELKVWGTKRLEDVPARQLAEALDGLHLRSGDDLLATIGEGGLSVSTAIRRLVPNAARPASLPVVHRADATGRVIVEGTRLPYTLAPCCNPIFPQLIVGYITRGSGVTVHARDCSNLPLDTERYTDCRWETRAEEMERVVCRLEITSINRIGLLSDITGIISRRRLNFGTFTSRDNEEAKESTVAFAVEVPDLFVLAEVMRRLEQLPGVMTVRRL